MSRTSGRSRGPLAAAIAAMVLGVLAGPASAAHPTASPPGNSAVYQYTQSFPSANGPQQAAGLRDGEALASPRAALGGQQARHLQERGSDGRELAELAAATAPRRAANGATGGGAGNASAEQGSSGISQVLGQALGTSSSSEMGLALPLILLATAAWAALYAWRRRPRSA